MAGKTYTRAEVANHNTEGDLWCIIDARVYDLTDFVDAHPGGNVVLRNAAGKDATKEFYNLHRQEVLNKYESLCIGTIEREKPQIIIQRAGELSQVPYAEPLWLRPEFRSPYYNESHRKLQKVVRKFVDQYIYPEAQAKEADGTYISQELIQRMVKENLIGMRLGPGKHLHGKDLFSGTMKGEDFDYFHDLVTMQEMSRINARGFADGNLGGLVISLTAIRNWLQNQKLRDRVTENCMTGKEFSCLCISEAFAGSDVAGMKTTCEKTPDGKYYIING
jgi:predicted heme/steroid binding protein